MPRIDDVAASAGVSIKTVSRVLNNEPHVRPELKARVLQAVEQLGYRPNQSARRLAGGRSFIVAFLYNNPTPSYIAGIQAGAATRCRELGYHLVVEPMELTGEDRLDVLDRLVSALKPDSAFLIPPLSDDQELLDRLAQLKVPVARIAGFIDMPGYNIETPERAAARMVVDHLAALGHRRVAMVAPPSSHGSAMQRVAGYLEGMEAIGINQQDAQIVSGTFDFHSGIEAADILLAQPVPPTAIFAANDEMALGVMICARNRGLSIPRDLSVVGFDEVPASKTTWPPLTTVRQPLVEMGIAVIDALVEKTPPTSPLRFELVPGGTTAAPLLDS